jgi:Recombination endonuclease VII
VRSATERARDRRYRQAHPDRVAARKSRWYHANKARVRASKKEWTERNHIRVRDGYLRWRYGITLAEYEALLAEQGGGCAICGATDPGSNRRYLFVDHDHSTDLIRGLLCANCNLALGKFRDDPSLLRKAADYLDGRGRGTRELRSLAPGGTP